MKAIIAACFVFLMLSCGSGTENTQTVKGVTFMLEVPASMKTTTTLNDAASVQFQNPAKELYVIVIDESKAELQKALDDNSLYDMYNNDLQGYYDLLSESIKSRLSKETLPKPVDTKINGLKAKLLDVEGTMAGYHIYWKFAFIEGKKHYYQIMAWTLADRRKNHEAAMQAMINSFRETDKSRY